MICTERYKTHGFYISVIWHKEWRFRYYKHLRNLEVGPLSIGWGPNRYLAADKIVEGRLEAGASSTEQEGSGAEQ